MDKDLYDLPPKELKKIPTVCGSLRDALANLDKDRTFLKAGGVFDDDFIDSYIELKMDDVIRFEMTPHPVEFDMYYSLLISRCLARRIAITLEAPPDLRGKVVSLGRCLTLQMAEAAIRRLNEGEAGSLAKRIGMDDARRRRAPLQLTKLLR